MAQTHHQAGAVKAQKHDSTNWPPVLHPCFVRCPAGLGYPRFTLDLKDLSQVYSSNHVEMVLGWTGEVKAGPCLPGLWLAQSLLLYIKYYFWRLGGRCGRGRDVAALSPG